MGVAQELGFSAAILRADRSAVIASASSRLDRSAWSWAAFEAGRDPYVILVTIYVFMPYFATVMVGDAVRGQAIVAGVGKTAGWIVALTAPFVGAAFDRYGPRRWALAAVALLMAPLAASLWWATPDGGGLSVSQVVTIAIALGVLFAYAEMLHNSMLPVAGRANPASASGVALALGSAVGTGVLLLILWGLVLPGTVHWPGVPDQPWFGLDRALHEPERLVGFVVAALLVAGTVPLVAFARDAQPTGASPWMALRIGAGDLLALVRRLGDHRNAALYLLARMVFADAMAALVLFGGVFAAGVMSWGALEMLAYGIALSVCAVGGGLLAGWLDGALGAKRALQIEIVGVLVATLALLGMAPDRIFYLAASAEPVWGSPMFASAPELAFLASGCSIAVWVTATYASSRTLLAQLVPPSQAGAFFGLYALAGTATAWLAPWLVEAFTRAFSSQRAGYAPIVILLLLGLGLLSRVRSP